MVAGCAPVPPRTRRCSMVLPFTRFIGLVSRYRVGTEPLRARPCRLVCAEDVVRHPFETGDLPRSRKPARRFGSRKRVLAVEDGEWGKNGVDTTPSAHVARGQSLPTRRCLMPSRAVTVLLAATLGIVSSVLPGAPDPVPHGQLSVS